MHNILFACSVQAIYNLKLILKYGTIILSKVPYNTCLYTKNFSCIIYKEKAHLQRHHCTDYCKSLKSLQTSCRIKFETAVKLTLFSAKILTICTHVRL